MGLETLGATINIIQEVVVMSVGDCLKINHFHLTKCPKTISKNWLVTGRNPPPLYLFDTHMISISVYLTDLSCYVRILYLVFLVEVAAFIVVWMMNFMYCIKDLFHSSKLHAWI
jgi:hypothetical protein